jgi:hypothetical protein
MEWLEPELVREDALDSLDVLRNLARSDTPVTHRRLLAVLDSLHGGMRTSEFDV